LHGERQTRARNRGARRNFTDEEPNMNVKYYTHFVLREGAPRSMSEYRGVVEVSRAVAGADFRMAASVLARNFDCASKDIQVLQWSRLH
jgi:hypothetical protein